MAGLLGSSRSINPCFYGLALFSASRITWKEVRTLGLLEIILGLTGVMLPGYGLFFWAAGFGLLHILYGFSCTVNMNGEIFAGPIRQSF